MNIVNGNNEAFDINIPFVRDAILYYTIQQYFNNNDKKTGSSSINVGRFI